jgi:DNA invertase Pin-like site-specific DNA recombinase
MKTVYGYIRVSTKEQGETASLPEQKSAIAEYAKKNSMKVIHWYEEKKTAAKQGRPLFTEMLNNLKAGKAHGVIMHKIDRSARNLHDWAMVGDLTDSGIEVHFAHESLDMTERGGRLTADIQAVMASDYVRNLRQETIKGLYGRLKQGLYPWMAPIGYQDHGKGQVKTLDPIMAPLVKELFELYSSGKYNTLNISKVMYDKGLRNKRGNKVCKNGIGKILRNPFYTGIMVAKDQTFPGVHEPLISHKLFKTIQSILDGRVKTKGHEKHFHLLRRLIKCNFCNQSLRGEIQKGHVYYRCHTKDCPGKTKREDHAENIFKKYLKLIKLSPFEVKELKKTNELTKAEQKEFIERQKKGIHLSITNLKNKESSLLDAYLENMITKKDYHERKSKLVIQIAEEEELLGKLEEKSESIFTKIEEMVELCTSPLKHYESLIKEEKREVIEMLRSNFVLEGRKLMFTMRSPFKELANRGIFNYCALKRDTARTLYPQQNINFDKVTLIETFTYSEINTSPILPKPLTKKGIENFYSLLASDPHILKDFTPLKNHELQNDNPHTQ